MTAYRSLASWRADGPFGAWLTRIAVRIALRRVGQRRSVTWLDTADAGGVGASIPADPALDPATQAMRAERAADLRTAVSRAAGALPRGRRPALLRRALAGRDRPPDGPAARHGQDPPATRPPPAARDGRFGARRMTGPIRRFDPSELAGGGDPEPSTAELADALAVARELESLTAEPGIRPTAGFEDRVMAAIATEPAPRLVIRPGSAVRGGRAGALLLAIRDSWGIATSGGRPMAMRAQALAFVFLAVVAVGALTGVGAMTVGSLLAGDRSPARRSRPARRSCPARARPASRRRARHRAARCPRPARARATPRSPERRRVRRRRRGRVRRHGPARRPGRPRRPSPARRPGRPEPRARPRRPSPARRPGRRMTTAAAVAAAGEAAQGRARSCPSSLRRAVPSASDRRHRLAHGPVGRWRPAGRRHGVACRPRRRERRAFRPAGRQDRRRRDGRRDRPRPRARAGSATSRSSGTRRTRPRSSQGRPMTSTRPRMTSTARARRRRVRRGPPRHPDARGGRRRPRPALPDRLSRGRPRRPVHGRRRRGRRGRRSMGRGAADRGRRGGPAGTGRPARRCRRPRGPGRRSRRGVRGPGRCVRGRPRRGRRARRRRSARRSRRTAGAAPSPADLRPAGRRPLALRARRSGWAGSASGSISSGPSRRTSLTSRTTA